MTAAGILAPVAASLGLNPILIGLAAGAGALFCIHVTSNTFWLLQSFLGQSVRGALKSVTVGVSVASIVALGMVLPLLFSELNLAHVVICVILLVVIRPATGWIALGGLGMARSDRAIAAIYGVRGIGAIYYLTYAASHGDFEEMPSLWALVALVILVSTILHGFTVGWAMRHATK